MPRIRKTAVQEAVELLDNALLAASMDGATFPAPGEFPFSPASLAYSAEAKARTEHYRQVWIIEPLLAALDILKAELALDRDHPLLLGAPTERQELDDDQKAELARINAELREANARKRGEAE